MSSTANTTDTTFSQIEQTQYLFNANQQFAFTGSGTNGTRNYFEELIRTNVQINASAIRAEAIPASKQLAITNEATILDSISVAAFNNNNFSFTSDNAHDYIKTQPRNPVTLQRSGESLYFVEGSTLTHSYELGDVVTGDTYPSSMFASENTSLIGNFKGINIGPVTFRALVPMIRVNPGEDQAWIGLRARPRKKTNPSQYFTDTDILSGLDSTKVVAEDLLTNIIPLTEGVDAPYKPQVFSLNTSPANQTDLNAIGNRVYKLFADGESGGHPLIDANSGVVTFHGFDTIKDRIMIGDYKVPHISCFEYTGAKGISNTGADDAATMGGDNEFTGINTFSSSLSVSSAFADELTVHDPNFTPGPSTDANTVMFVDKTYIPGMTAGDFTQALQFGSGEGSWRFIVKKVPENESYYGQVETRFIIEVLDGTSWIEKFSFTHDKRP